MGMCIGGPIGMLAGVKIGGFSAVMGSILGYTGASVVKEHQDFRQYIDEHYEQEPQLYVQSPKDDSLNKRRVSRSLPEIPGQRPLGSAKYMVGPNGYRRPSLVRASSFSEQRNVNIRVNMIKTSSIDQRSYRPEYVRNNSMEGQRRLPSRPFTRLASSEQQGARRAQLSRSNSNLHRKMSYRQQSLYQETAARDSFHYSQQERPDRAQHRNFRRYGAHTEVERRAVLALIAREREVDMSDSSYMVSSQAAIGCDRRSRWGRQDFQSSTRESRDIQLDRDKQRYLARRHAALDL